jgi:hypothetical protein
MSTVQPGIYHHYKNKDNEYDVLGVGHHTETLEELVFYRARYDTEDFGPTPLWVRPLAMFTDMVETPEGTTPRFTFLRPFDAS